MPGAPSVSGRLRRSRKHLLRNRALPRDRVMTRGHILAFIVPGIVIETSRLELAGNDLLLNLEQKIEMICLVGIERLGASGKSREKSGAAAPVNQKRCAAVA